MTDHSRPQSAACKTKIRFEPVIEIFDHWRLRDSSPHRQRPRLPIAVSIAEATDRRHWHLVWLGDSVTSATNAVRSISWMDALLGFFEPSSGQSTEYFSDHGSQQDRVIYDSVER